MKRLKALIILLLITLLCIFAVSNMETVRLNYWGSRSLLGYRALPSLDPEVGATQLPREVPVYLLIFLCLALGFFGSWIWSLGDQLRRQRQIRQLRRELADKEKELDSLRNMPVDGIPSLDEEQHPPEDFS